VRENLQRLRQKYSGKSAPPRPFAVDERNWTIFSRCVFDKNSFSELGKQTRLTPTRIRAILAEVDVALDSAAPVNADAPLEALDLSVRSRNALHRLGCRTVGEVSALDLTQSLRQIGSKGKMEVFNALEKAGFRHPAMDGAPSSEISRVTRSLERLKTRIHKTMEGVLREISALQEKLGKESS